MNAMREGLQNAYQYSKSVNGPLAQAMDTFASSAQVVKNQLGAALGGAIVAILPLIQTLANALARAAEYITMFFAALNGQGTFKKAINNTTEWGKAAGGAGKAAKEWKNQLMGFDEINRLDSPEEPSGGGGGGTVANFGDMFTQAPVEEWMKRLGERIKDLLPIIKAVGIGLAGLSVAKLLGQLLPLGAGFSGIIQKIAGVGIAILGATLLFDGFVDSLENGLDWGNFWEMIGGGTLLFIGLGIAFGKAGVAIGLLVAGFALATAGLMEIIKTGKITKESFVALTTGILAIGAAIFLLTGSWIPLVIAGVVSIALAVVTFWDDIKGVLARVWDAVVGFVNRFLAFVQPVIDFFRNVWGFLKSGINTSISVGAYSASNPMPAYASGGFPEDGMFMANHGELVGQFTNGQTAVANNAEIVAGIERGVYNAMSSVMASQNQRPIENRVYLDGKEIGASVRRYERNTNRATGVTYG